MSAGRSARWVLAASLAAALAASCTDIKRFGYEGFGRDRWQHPERVVDALGIESGHRVADLGSGGGYFTFRLADAVGSEGIVLAVDVDAGMNEYLEKRAREEGRENVDVVLAAYDDPRIPPPGVDLLFTCNTYHHIEERAKYFASARRYLRPDARVAIIDYKPDAGFLQRIFGHGTADDVIKSEMEAAGYRLVRKFYFLPRQNFLIFAIGENE